MKKILLVRHGSIKKKPHILVGAQDLPLSEKGRKEIHCLAQSLPLTFWQKLQLVLCSDLRRCQESAQLLLRAKPKACPLPPLKIEAKFREISLGAWEGLSKSEIQKRWPGQWEERGQNLANFAPPSGESFKELSERVLDSLNFWGQEPGELLCLVTHAGVMRVVIANLLALPLEQILKIPLSYACSFLLSLDDLKQLIARKTST
ncbi:MAG: histidine phosphatase family protein [Desulfovibrio sp.]|nr:histidine phosphatase family protein [Desulfovibrio sp.]